MLKQDSFLILWKDKESSSEHERNVSFCPYLLRAPDIQSEPVTWGASDERNAFFEKMSSAFLFG